MLKRRQEYNIYLTQRLLTSLDLRKPSEKMKYKELSPSTVAFSCRCRLTKVFTGTNNSNGLMFCITCCGVDAIDALSGDLCISFVMMEPSVGTSNS
jgi:hypothetical protein